MAKKQRIHNEWFRPVSLGNRKSCPECHAKLSGAESVWSWGEHVRAKWRTVKHFCKECYPKNVQALLVDHRKDCGCEFELIGYLRIPLPGWLTLPPYEGHCKPKNGES